MGSVDFLIIKLYFIRVPKSSLSEGKRSTFREIVHPREKPGFRTVDDDHSYYRKMSFGHFMEIS